MIENKMFENNRGRCERKKKEAEKAADKTERKYKKKIRIYEERKQVRRTDMCLVREVTGGK